MAESSFAAPAIEQHSVSTPSGDLELLGCSPSGDSLKSPILCLHGAFCSAEDYRNFLPFFASYGHPAYSLSLRGHGKSWATSWMTRTLLTTLDDYVADIIAAATFIVRRHPEAPPMVLVGHSFGGGHMQYLLAYQGQNGPSLIKFGGLVLLASAPLSGGGKEITANWEKVEAPNGYKYPWSPRSQLDTPDQVRAAFFQPETGDEVIEKWLKDCRTVKEGIRTGISVFWPFGEARYVLKNLVGLQGDSTPSRKVLLVAASEDRLVKPAVVEENAKAYEVALAEASESGQGSDTNEVVMSCSIPGSAHHLMMDLAWKECAERIVDWVEGRVVRG
ncbi:hypothetical protein FSARC_1721 [Fusarium sarcochroum]|uniref:AB hydrolase-1 domain-containing protein n=1 Tax=Fusarium sarcochroum TaxID=1208366 RepID=A0A8H4XDU4_9HYPO|nr:hypothetical protein FSARC_1721 [Fusarium sarcochroum]